ncbi:hypothetical protein BJ875DRAFT_539516 [Amylocarpus encephaloides]|uniref:Rhodopsin domain-containing protein n=1 Tax=Amylocarpus encephaloides TaxID=45428 RepID=A0A9P8CAX4_9HELO|nr:hypothetical protein BJ875DRAFT_539516 [Amylocarpus encephaloides]
MAGDPREVILGFSVAFPILAILAVSGRFYARRLKNVGCIGVAINSVIGIYEGDLGIRQPRDAEGIVHRSPKLATYKKLNYALTPIFLLAITAAKISVLILYRRIFCIDSFRIPYAIVLSLNILFGVSFFFVYIFQCIPIADYWSTTLTMAEKKCIRGGFCMPFAYGSAALDFLTLVLSVPYVMRLYLPWGRKITLLGVFFMGGVVLITSVAKAVAFQRIISIKYTLHEDPYDGAPVFYWTLTEACFAVVAACLPTLRPVFLHWVPDSLLSSLRSMVGPSAALSTSNSRSEYTKETDSGSEFGSRSRRQRDAGTEPWEGEGEREVRSWTEVEAGRRNG